ncbi:hypothetical protein BGZ57DRAFT_853997 [Hyaloscypha finlandica]|nr:hypothetical protein BGZ57DRAFT_853997 [Hyaloscypha finlandica]
MADRDFSTLETVNLGYQPLRNHETLTADLGKQVVTGNAGKEVIKSYSDGIEPTSNQQYSTATKDYHEPLWWWIGGVTLLLVILGAVLGGVLGTRKSRKSSSSTPVSNSSTPTNATLVYNIAALAFESGTVKNTGVSYQDNAGMLIEAAQSNSNYWEITKIELLEKKISTLAATVSRPRFPMEISVFYTDNNNEVHDLLYNSTSRKWSQGILFQKHYEAYPNSTMSAMYHQCRLCSKTTIMTF